MEDWKGGRIDFARVLSECTSHLGEYAANRGRHGERGERGKKRFSCMKHFARMELIPNSFAPLERKSGTRRIVLIWYYVLTGDNIPNQNCSIAASTSEELPIR